MVVGSIKFSPLVSSVYATNFGSMNSLIAYLTENCCGQCRSGTNGGTCAVHHLEQRCADRTQRAPDAFATLTAFD